MKKVEAFLGDDGEVYMTEAKAIVANIIFHDNSNSDTIYKWLDFDNRDTSYYEVSFCDYDTYSRVMKDITDNIIRGKIITTKEVIIALNKYRLRYERHKWSGMLLMSDFLTKAMLFLNNAECKDNNNSDHSSGGQWCNVGPDLLMYAKEVMGLLESNGPSIVIHLLDTDDNPGQFLRDAIAKAERKDDE